MARPPLRQLTGLRFWAAFGVALCHYADALGIPAALRFATNFFGSFVALFFVLSGYVLTYNYADKLADEGGLGSYFLARVARVVPVYWLTLIATLMLYAACGFGLSLGGPADYGNKAGSFVLNLLALQAWIPDVSIQQYWNAPGWSISAEMFFYLCFPLLLRWRWLNGSTRSIVALWCCMATLLLLYYSACTWLLAGDPARLHVWLLYAVRCPLFGLFCFVLGIHLARSDQASSPGPRVKISGTSLFGWGIAILLASFIVDVYKRTPHAFVDPAYVEISATYLIYTPFYYFIISYLREPDGALARALSLPGMVVLGEASYALYLLHWSSLSILSSGPAGLRVSPAVAFLTLTGVVIASVIVYLVFENPLRVRIRRLRRLQQGAERGAAAP